MENRIPTLKSTNDAHAFGKVASPEQLKKLQLLREVYLRAFDRIIERPTCWDAAAILATKAQLCREAIEVS